MGSRQHRLLVDSPYKELCHRFDPGDLVSVNFNGRFKGFGAGRYLDYFSSDVVQINIRRRAFHQDVTGPFTKRPRGDHDGQGNEETDSRVRIEPAVPIPFPDDDGCYYDAGIVDGIPNDVDHDAEHAKVSTTVSMLALGPLGV
ncbi:hypothetical protein ColTof4_02492 [Colletotrichum tofieldiae]|nr:hypothetical protein ColTof3_09217 [Colletotrichum tofieldiae]GKT70069.1 hypothetical protein ColTof4_02492 [Colletotrichum tofieldiae]GKT93103.1 hypothetical protein Ct61P_10953 [Colletotrichum tofieldiae]